VRISLRGKRGEARKQHDGPAKLLQFHSAVVSSV
jgi:hypothetical protein